MIERPNDRKTKSQNDKRIERQKLKKERDKKKKDELKTQKERHKFGKIRKGVGENKDVYLCPNLIQSHFLYHHKRYLIIDQQIARHLMHYSDCLYNPHSLLCNSNN